MKRKLLISVGLLSIAGLFAHRYFSSNSAVNPEHSKPSPGELVYHAVPSPAQQHRKATLTEQNDLQQPQLILPEIFSGSSVPGGIRTDNTGNLILDEKLRLTLDYFTQIMGIEGANLDALRKQIKGFLERSLSEPALSQALDIFNRYWDYNLVVNARQDEESLRQIKESFQGQYNSDHIAAIQAFRSERDSLRAHYFNPQEISVFFSGKRRYEQYMDQRMKIAAMETDKAEKWLRLAELEQTLPKAEQTARKRMSMIKRYKQYELILDDQSMTGTDLESRLFDNKEIQQFKAIHAQRDKWTSKKIAYEEYKHQLERNGINNTELVIMLDQYMRNQEFSALEIRRMKALENRLN